MIEPFSLLLSKVPVKDMDILFGWSPVQGVTEFDRWFFGEEGADPTVFRDC